MILNGKSLLRASPIMDMLDHKVQASPTSYGLTECGYDIRIAEDIVFDPFYKDGWSDNNEYPHVRRKGKSCLDNMWRRGRCVLTSSIELFQMPTNLMGRVLNKSTWARHFVDASLTTNIEPGWKGYLTIELVFNGEEFISIPAGSGICQIIFETLAEEAQYVGKYQDQEAGPQPAR